MSLPAVRKYLFWVGVPLLLAALYALAGFLLVPRLVRSGLQDYVAEHYHRRADVGEIRFNPFTFTLDVHSFALPDADAQPLLSFSRLLIDLDAATLWRRGPSFAQIALDDPFVRVLIRKDGSLNLADLSKPLPGEAPAAKPADSKPLRLFIDRFTVRGGRTTFEDQTRAQAFRAELKPISFDLRDFSTTEQTGNTYALSGASDAGERFNWNGTVRLNPLASQGRFELADVQVHTLWSYLRDSLHFETTSGSLGLNGDYDFSAAGSAIGLKVNVHNLAVVNLGLKPKGADANSVALARLEVNETALDADRHTVTIGKVQLSGGDIRAWLDPAGRLNLLDLAGPATQPNAPSMGESDSGASNVSSNKVPAQPSATAQAPAQSVWLVSVPDISVTEFKVTAEDRQVTPAVSFSVTPLNAHITGFTTAPGAQLSVEANTAINESAKLTTTAKVSPDTGAVSADVALEKLELPVFQPYLAKQTQLTLLTGQLGAKLHIDRAADGALAIDGDTDVAKLRTIDNDYKRDFISWDRVRVQKLRYRSMPASLQIGSILAQAPYARVIIAKDRTVNVSDALSPAGAKRAAESAPPEPEAAPPAAKKTASRRKPPAQSLAANTGGVASDSKSLAPGGAPGAVNSPKPASVAATSGAKSGANAPSAAPMDVSIGTVRFTNGSATFADLWIQPNFAVGIQTLNGAITGLSSNPRSRAKVQLEGKVDRYAPVVISGDVNLFSAAAYSDIKMNFKSIEMTTVTPYSGHFAGYKIEKGKLSLDLNYHVQDRKLKADHRFVIDQLQLGERVESPDAIHLPLRLAVALLKDRNGVIDINLPVTGSLDDPKFRIGPIIWKAVLNLLTKIVTAPFALLGSLFGGGEDMNLIDFAPGSAALDPAAQERLAGLLKALNERPQLQLDVPMVYSPDADGPVLTTKRLQDALLEIKRAEPVRKRAPDAPPIDATVLDDPAEHYRLLIALYRAQSGKDAALPALSQVIEDAGKKKTDVGAYPPAITELETAIRPRLEIPKAELEALGKQRSESIQQVLLANGGVDPARVFVITSEPKAATGGAVRMELSLK